MTITSYEVYGETAVITMNNPPVNGLSLDLRRSLIDSLDRAEEDAGIKAVVLAGIAIAFSGGADIREFSSGGFMIEPVLGIVIKLLDSYPKPVIAAIGGACMGGGLELALACHYRVAIAGAQVALPEVKLGIIPGAGGTQRLPRLIGLEPALDMIVSGNPLPAEKLRDTRLFDQIIDGELLAGALAFAAKVIAEKRGVKRVRDLDLSCPDLDAFVAAARSKVAPAAKNLPAPLKAVEAVAAAATLPIDAGLAFETRLLRELMQTPESRALRHAFFGERATAKIPDVPADTPTRRIDKVAIIGSGTMGSGIAMNFLQIGIPVVLLETSQEALDRGIAGIRKIYEGSVKKGKLSAEKLEQRMQLLTGTLSYDALKDADLVIEAVFEDMNVKEKVFRILDKVMKPGAILASNTSTLDLDQIALFTSRPQDVIGMHFFSPANVMRLLEVVRGAKTGKDVLATVMALARKIKKLAVVAGVCDGFIGNRMLHQYLREAWFLLDEGALPWQIDHALESWGMAMGPFRMNDMAGNDVTRFVRQRQQQEFPAMKFSRIADKLCDLGRYGQKTGAGWYRYEPGNRDALPDPVVEQLIVDHSREIGIQRREIGDEEIVERLIYALVNEGAKLLEEGIALRASDIDMVYLAGYGFPAFRGGPMLYADSVGLYNVLRSIKRFARNQCSAADIWQPATLLVKLTGEGKTFN